MNDTPDSLRRRRRGRRKGAKETVRSPEPAVQALIDQVLQPTDGAFAPSPADGETVPAADAAPVSAPDVQSPPLTRAAGEPVPVDQAPGEAAIPAPGDDAGDDARDPPSDAMSIYDRWRIVGETPAAGGADADSATQTDVPDAPDATPGAVDDDTAGAAPPIAGGPAVQAQPAHHHWVYLAAALFLAAIGFGLWGLWLTFFADPGADARSAAALRARSEKLSQEVATLRRSDQISRDANRDLERTLAERDEEIAGLRADVAFYERFVGATGQRRGLSVHDLEMSLVGGDAWHFRATLTQNVNRGAVNGGRITLSLEGTRDDRLERLSWSTLRKQNNAPGLPYSFKYFQQVEGEVMLPKGFKPLRVTVRLVPQGGSAVEESFPWPETVRGAGSG